jgi:hypothetical protein
MPGGVEMNVDLQIKVGDLVRTRPEAKASTRIIKAFGPSGVVARKFW